MCVVSWIRLDSCIVILLQNLLRSAGRAYVDARGVPSAYSLPQAFTNDPMASNVLREAVTLNRIQLEFFDPCKPHDYLLFA